MASVRPEIESSTAVITLGATLLVMLTPLAPDALEATLSNLSAAFAGEAVTVAISDAGTALLDRFEESYPHIRRVASSLVAGPAGAWVLTASEYLALYKDSLEAGVAGCVLLGPDSQTLSVEALRGLAASLSSGADLVVPRYEIGPREGLVNSALLYPVHRAIFGAGPRFPLAVDLGISLRLAARLASVAQKFTALNQNDALIWPVAEAAVAGYRIVEIEAGARSLPQPVGTDLNSLLAHIAASLFTEVEQHAAFWQRARVTPIAPPPGQRIAEGDTFPDVQPMLDSFQLAYTNLHEIWSLVLPPNSLLSLKRLAAMPAESFRMGDALWARIVYDFILAYRLRTINRGHLLGALTPLYLAWVASHIVLARGGTESEQHIEQVAAAFEADKAYLVSRWRWPDRFNP